MLQADFTIVGAGDMSGTVTSSNIPLSQDWGVSVQAVFTGSPAGTFKLQISNDVGSNISGTGVTNWSDFTGSSQTISAAGNYMWDVVATSVRWMRLVYTPSSGTGTLVAKANLKGV